MMEFRKAGGRQRDPGKGQFQSRAENHCPMPPEDYRVRELGRDTEVWEAGCFKQ